MLGVLGKAIYLSWSALLAITTPSMDSARTYVDPDRVEQHVLETFSDMRVSRCPVTIIATANSVEGTEATAVPHCSIGYPVVRFIERRDGNLLAYVLDEGHFVLLASRF